MVKAFQANGPVFKSPWNGIGGQERIGKAQYGQDAEGRTSGQVERGRDYRGTGAL